MAFGLAIEDRFVQCMIHQQQFGCLGMGLSVLVVHPTTPGPLKRRRACARRPAAAGDELGR